jgi:hypothetical protein
MAIDGSGTQQDPWIVTTYDELVEKAAESGEYVRIANDINITDEYPDGDMPQLVLKANVDGNGKKLSNWYKTTYGTAIYVQGATAQLYNCTIGNIYCKNDTFAEIRSYNQDFHFVNCNFHGITYYDLFKAIDENNSTRNFSSCSFYINSKNNGYAAIVSNMYSYIGMQYCSIKVASSTASTVFAAQTGTFVDSCYIESTIPCGSYSSVKNSVLDLTTNTTFTANGNASNDLNIINSTHAPNATAGDGFALVDDTHWKDVNYLSSIGFNAG